MQIEPCHLILGKFDTPCAEVKNLVDIGAYRNHDTNPTPSLYLKYSQGALTIHLSKDDETMSFCINFVDGKAKHRRQYGGGKNQSLAKACGLYKHPDWSIFDATAGLGRDAFVLASLGSKITLCEQHPVLFGMLSDALHRARTDESTALIANRMTCVCDNSTEHLSSKKQIADRMPDVIYLDPMYPVRKKSAKIKKEMQVLQHLVGHSQDDAALMEQALKTARHRVVVKRPKSAQPLSLTVEPSYAVSSVNTRYDVYSI